MIGAAVGASHAFVETIVLTSSRLQELMTNPAATAGPFSSSPSSPMYDLPSRKDIGRCLIDTATVLEKVNPALEPRVPGGPTKRPPERGERSAYVGVAG